ncbi:hypothetical protein FRC17_000235 [Serendipita sp. 399]|nr:hypothetical protein FRC17_000235 [Serendipita sp. 399]
MSLPIGRIGVRTLKHSTSLLRSKAWAGTFSVRTIHHSLQATAKKKKTKHAADNDIFDEGDEGDDLFGSHSNPSKPSVSTRVDTESSINKLTRDSAKARVNSAQELELQRTNEKQRENGKKDRFNPGKSALIRFIKMVETTDDFRSLMSILKNWRIYPATPLRSVVNALVVETALKSNNIPSLLSVLEHHPLYGISVPTPSLARQLLHVITSPVDTYPPVYSPSLNRTPESQTESSVYRQRMDDVLRLKEILSKTRVKVPRENPPVSDSPVVGILVDGSHGILSSDEHVSVSLAPENDLISGSLLLSSLLRVITSGMEDTEQDSISAYIEVAVELAQNLAKAARRGKITNSANSKDQSWALAALQESKMALSQAGLAEIPNRQHLTTWIDAGIALLAQQLAHRGKAVASRVKNLGNLEPLNPAFVEVFGRQNIPVVQSPV